MERKSILVLCDSCPFLKALSGALAFLASTVYEASDIPSAKQLILEGKPDLVIIDFPAEGPHWN
jgi:CheY-like chemotaxis protein